MSGHPEILTLLVALSVRPPIGIRRRRAVGRKATEREKQKYRDAYAADPESYKARSAQYRVEHPDKIKAMSVRYREENRTRINTRQRMRFDRLRREAILAYGGKCAVCGEVITEFLCLDHINGDGAEDRRNGLYGSKLYAQLREQGWPQGRLRVLCYNCNFGLALHRAMSVPQPVRQSRYTRGAKAEMIVAYGGECVCCGETNPLFLSLDHINGNGQDERKEHGRGRAFYQYLKSLGYPRDNYRLLCHNCNASLGHYGYCPHRGLRK